MSAFGEWTTAEGLPAFSYRAGLRHWDPIIDPTSSRHAMHVGNRRITLVADTDGRTGVWDEHLGCRWLAEHTGVGRFGSLATDAGGAKLFGPTFFRVSVAEVQRTVLCPEGEVPWVLIRVDVVNPGDVVLRRSLTEEWVVRPRLVNLEFGPARDVAPPDAPLVGLEAFGGERVQATAGVLRVSVEVEVEPGGRTTEWFRFGLLDEVAMDPATLYETSLSALRHRLPSATTARAPEAATEIPWHAALLTGGACVDGVLGGHTLNQGSAYSFRHGFNGAARDPLQHALPLVHLEPDLALSVLRNTCAWGSPDGDLPYALDGRKQPWTQLFRPSDQNLWALWLAAEYADATGDLAAFEQPVPYHPCHGADPVPLRENLRRQFRFFADEVGVGEYGHVRILNADWNDLAVTESTVDRELMVERGESVLNSAMAAWVLPVYAGLAERLGDRGTAAGGRRPRRGSVPPVSGIWSRASGTDGGSGARTHLALRRSATTTCGSRCSRGRSCAVRPRPIRRARCCARSTRRAGPGRRSGRGCGGRCPPGSPVRCGSRSTRRWSGRPPVTTSTWRGTSGVG